MKTKLTILLIVVGVLIGNPNSTQSIDVPVIKPEKAQIQEYISKYSKEYSISKNTLEKVILCESTGNPRAIHYNDGGKGKHSVGILQFQESTFIDWEKKLGEDLDYYSYQDQIKLGSYMIKKGQLYQWTCGRKLAKV